MPLRTSRLSSAITTRTAAPRTTVVPCPGRARDAQPAVERLDAVGQAAQPAAARVVGAADAVVGDLDRRAVAVAPHAHVGARRVGVLRDVRQRLAGDEVGRELDRLRQAAGRLAGRPSSARRARRERARGRRARPCSSTAGWMPRASSRSSSSERRELLARGGDERLGGRSSPTRFCSRRSCSAIATSRCCAPSWRLRSSRRRSASPASTIRSRDARSSAQPGLRLGVQPGVLDRHRRPRRRRPRAAPGPPRATRRTRAPRLRARRARRAPRSGRRPARAASTRPAVGVGVGVVLGQPVGDDSRGSPSVRPSAACSVGAADRAQHREQLGQPAAREARAQQPGQERGRHGSPASRRRATAASATARP